MSDTDKCPMCGSEMKWNAFSGSCTNIDCLFFVRTNAKELRIEMAYDTALHRIRELEARIAAKDAALADIDMIACGPRTVIEQYEEIVDIAREALKK